MAERVTFVDRVANGTLRGTRYVANRPGLLVLATVGNLVVCAGLYAILEHRGPIEGAWWAIVTGFTVGYGDQYPASAPGRAVGAWLIVSFFLLALFLGSMITTNMVVDRDAFTHEEQEEIKALLRELRDRLDAADIGENPDGTVAEDDDPDDLKYHDLPPPPTG